MANKILVVDDEPDLEHLMRQRLRRDMRAGRFELVFAHNGVQALAKLEADREIDMVLSDINMPEMDGLTLLDQIPNVDPNIRAVIVSAYGDMQNIRTAMNRGAFDFVTKPIDFNDLRITIDKTMRHLAVMREALASRDKLVALQNELDVASKMQQSILPTTFPQLPTCEVFGNMVAAREVGGDFFDVIPLENGRLGIAIADVSGKGVPAAMFMMSSRTLLKGAAIGTPQPSDVLREVNDLLERDNESLMFVTLFYGVYDPATGKFTYANGGHNPPLIVRPGRYLLRTAADERHRPRRDGRHGFRAKHHHPRTRRHRSALHGRSLRSNERRQRGVRDGAIRPNLLRCAAERRHGGQPRGLRCGSGVRRQHAAVRRHHLPHATTLGVDHMTAKLSVRINATLDQLQALQAQVAEFGTAEDWSPRTRLPSGIGDRGAVRQHRQLRRRRHSQHQRVHRVRAYRDDHQHRRRRARFRSVQRSAAAGSALRGAGSSHRRLGRSFREDHDGRSALQARVRPEPRHAGQAARGVNRFLLGACAFGFAAGALASEDDRPPTPILFGQSAALSGPAQDLGINMRLGIKAAFQEANARGGVHGRQLALVSLDDAYEPERAIANTRLLAQDHDVFALIGAVGTPTSNAAVPVAADAGLPYVAPFTGAAFLRETPGRGDNVINLRASYNDETEAMVAHLLGDLGIERIAVMYQDDSFGRAGHNGVIKALRKRDMAPVAVGVYERNTTAVKTGLLDVRAPAIQAPSSSSAPTSRWRPSSPGRGASASIRSSSPSRSSAAMRSRVNSAAPARAFSSPK